MKRTNVIKNAEWVIAWDEQLKSHTYLRNADVAFAGNEIIYAGENYKGTSDHEINGKSLMVMPGLVNIHAHPCEDTILKGINESGYNLGLEGENAYIENVVDQIQVFRSMDETDPRPLGAEIGYSELLKSGVTTLLDICESISYPGWIELLERSGLRAYLGPMVPSVYPSEFNMDEQLDLALSIIDKAMANSTGRLSGAVVTLPVGPEGLLTPDILHKSRTEAKKRKIPWKVHGGQMFGEVDFVRKEYSMSPIEMLGEMGVLGPETILIHAHLLDHHPALNNEKPYKDLDIAARTGVSVSHAPYAFALSCQAMHDFARYREAGINIGLGTDIFGHNMLEEMRYTLLLSRITSGSVEGSTTADVLHAATIGGAKALQRNDIGHIREGAKADLVLVDLDHPAMKPVNDPLRSLIFQAAERAVRDVYIDGKLVVKDREVLTLDYGGASKKLDETMRPLRANAVEGSKEKRKFGDSSVFSANALPIKKF